MKKKLMVIVFSMILLACAFISAESGKIDEKVYDALENNLDVPVKIEISRGFLINEEKTKETIKDNIKEEKIISETSDEMIIHLEEAELEKIADKKEIESITFAPQFTAFLQDSVALINATSTWAVQVSSINITGVDVSVCVIDTGVNFSHPDLVEKNKTCIIDCYNKNCIENCSLADDNGHGTHASGIIASSGGINGVGKNLGLIGLKVLDSAGNSHPSTGTADIKNAIDWCVANRNNYNISAISLSLGTTTLYTAYCDDTFASNLAIAINNATFYNISVIAATGNSGSTTGIAAPACITNTTAVARTNKDDSINSDGNRNSITDFVAPGTSINSTKSTGGYIELSGTSMSAPHVSGAFALFRQFYKLYKGKVPLHSEIQATLNSTGKQIYDSGTGLTFSRIDIYSAILSVDDTGPNVSLASPPDNHLNSSQNYVFFCNATDDIQLKNITLQIWNALGDLYYNQTNSASGTFFEVNFSVNNLAYGSYKWNCLAYDKNNNKGYAGANFSLYAGNISVSLTSPGNNTHTKVNQTNFTCLSQTANIFVLKNVTFYLWNSTGIVNYSNQTISGNLNLTTFYYNLSFEEDYHWNCLAYSNASEPAMGSANNTLTFDVTSPVLSSYSSSVSSSEATISLSITEETNYSIGYGTTSAFGSNSNSSSFATSHSASISGLSASTTYYYNITICDRAANCITNGTYSFTTSADGGGGNNGGGGGGGGGAAISSKIYVITAQEISSSSGYTQELGKNDKIQFTFFDAGTAEHTLTLDLISSNSVELTIRSSPIKLKLGIGQSAKLNLTSSDYYDFYIKLNSIKNNKADITIQTISEKIPRITGETINKGEEENEKELPEKSNKTKDYIILILTVLLVISVLIILFRKKISRHELLREHREKFRQHYRR